MSMYEKIGFCWNQNKTKIFRFLLLHALNLCYVYEVSDFLYFSAFCISFLFFIWMNIFVQKFTFKNNFYHLLSYTLNYFLNKTKMSVLKLSSLFVNVKSLSMEMVNERQDKKKSYWKHLSGAKMWNEN